MLLIGMQWIFHCFRVQIDSVGVFVWALAPFLCLGVFCAFCFAFSAGETQVWLGGFAGRRFLCGCCFFVLVQSIC